MKRADVGAHLVPVFGLRDQHPRNEGAQRQAQARQLGQPRQPQRDQQQVQHEQLVALAPGHLREPPAHQALAAREQQAHQHGGLEQRQPQGGQQAVGRRAERRNQNQQGHHRKVLEQQDAHHAAAMFAFELGALGHQLDDDGRAAHGQHARQRQRRLPAHLPHTTHQVRQRQRQPRDHQHAQHHLRQPQAKHLAAHGAQLGQAELQPDGKHQEYHPELAQMAHTLRVLGQCQRMGPDQHARGKIPQHRRQFEAAAHHHAQHRGQ